jgi:Flp pilus assembly protein TadG
MTGFNREPSGIGGDRGATLVTFALSLVAICSVIALVLGGSIGYSAERNSQTASDAAALAATNRLWQVQTRAISATQVLETARSVAVANGANSSDVTCRLVAANRTHIEDCESASVAQFRAASGVAVDTRDTRDVPFGEVSGNTEITGATLAIATIQPVTSGRSPFMMCAPAPGHGPVKVLDSAGNINESAVGTHYMLQGTEMKNDGRDCGNPASNWRGWVDFDSTFPLPGEWAIENGNKNGHIPRQLLNDDACGGSGTDVNNFVGCTIAVPLCTSGNGKPGNQFRVNCVTWGAFKISHNGSGPSVCHSSSPQHICGEFVGGALAREGQGTEDKADPNEVVVIKLVR